MEERHQLLLSTIGVFKEESEACSLFKRLSWLLPTLLTIFTLVDLLLVLLYHKLGHPWARILKEVGTTPPLNEESST